MITSSAILCVLATYVHGAVVPSVPRFSLGEDRVVGGMPIGIVEAPYQVSFQRLNQHICGGSIISKRHILTAAHCSEVDSNTRNLAVGVGSVNLQSLAKFSVARNKFHPSYNKLSLDFDVAVLRLAKAVATSASVAVVPIVAVGEEPKEEEAVMVSGWGSTKSGGNSSSKLMAVTINIIRRSTCEGAYERLNAVTSRMICAGALRGAGGKDSCQGDSGGPLVSKSSRKQVGVVSWGYGCAKPRFPGVYTNIANSAIHQFISGQLKI